MSADVTEVFLSVSETDKQLVSDINRKIQIESEGENIGKGLEKKRADLEAAKTKFNLLEEHRRQDVEQLHEEEQKIAERRKQLSSIASVKSAKLLERDIEVATKTLAELEKKAETSTAAAEKAKEVITSLDEEIKTLDQDLEKFKSENSDSLEELSGLIKKNAKKRQKLVEGMNERARRLYDRVSRRYPGGAIALAKEGACQSCFRSLPFQLYNQILAGGTMIQCPGCSRVLVSVANEQ